MATKEGLPVHGYRPQSDAKVALVNAMKKAEEGILRALDRLADDQDVDKRWLAIGRTSIEQAFMAINRSIFRPARLVLEELTVEGGWLIEDAESPVSAPTYFRGDANGPSFTEDHHQAIRFARKQDAERFALMCSGTLDGVRIAFHEWG